MSLVDEMSEMCVRVGRVGAPDGEGGETVGYVEGHRFPAAVVRNGTSATRIGERDGSKSVFTVTTAEPLKAGDLFRRESDGRLLRCTSNVADGAAPGVATFGFGQCGAEETEEIDAQ